MAGVRKSFTDLPDETLFIDENTRGILCFQRAADALRHSGARRFQSGGRCAIRRGGRGAARGVCGERTAVRAAGHRSFLLLRAALLTSRTGSDGLNIVARTRAISPGSTKSTCCWACAMPMTRITGRSWSTRCCSWCRMIRHGCATACATATSWTNFWRLPANTPRRPGSRERDLVPGGVRPVCRDRPTAPRPVGKPVHQSASGDAGREASEHTDGEWAFARNAVAGAGNSAGLPWGRGIVRTWKRVTTTSRNYAPCATWRIKCQVAVRAESIASRRSSRRANHESGQHSTK